MAELRILYRWEAGRPRGGIVQNESILFLGDTRIGRVYRRTDVDDANEPWEWTCQLSVNEAGHPNPISAATEALAMSELLNHSAKKVCNLFQDVQPSIKLEAQG